MAPSQGESLPMRDLDVLAALGAKQMAFQGLQRGGSLLTSEYFKKSAFMRTHRTLSLECLV